jgi:hypothetical protein
VSTVRGVPGRRRVLVRRVCHRNVYLFVVADRSVGDGMVTMFGNIPLDELMLRGSGGAILPECTPEELAERWQKPETKWYKEHDDGSQKPGDISGGKS